MKHSGEERNLIRFERKDTKKTQQTGENDCLLRITSFRQ